ncbi:alkaline phosphatase [soil metagenome]
MIWIIELPHLNFLFFTKNVRVLYYIIILLIFQSCATNPTSSVAVDDQKSNELNNQALVQQVKVPRNVIFLIGDGMGLTQISAGMIRNNNYLNLERCQTVGLAKTSSSDNLVTDSAAGATALASGVKTYNGAIGVDPKEKPVPTLLEIASGNQITTGILATSSITHATPACFYAHQPSRKMNEEIAQDLVNSEVDIFIGGGRDYFVNRKDGRNLINDLKNKSFNIFENITELDRVENNKIGVFIADFEPVSFLEGREDFLPRATEKIIRLLNRKNNAFFLMVEGSQIDWKGHSNESEELISEMIDFDEAIGIALDFAEKDGETLVVVTADHETGGYAITGGDMETGAVEGKFITGSHTGVMVPVFAYGPGAHIFSGIYENTEIFHKIMEVWNLQNSTP